MDFESPAFWLALGQIIWINIILSGDNAVVIALAARGLPPKQQKQAIVWGSGAAVVLRIVLTLVAAALLNLPYLQIIGGLLLLYIGVQLLSEGEEEDGGGKEHGGMMAAVRTILIADLVMSLDNVIAVAAAAQGSLTLLILGLGISIPLVIFGSTMLLHLMERWPIIITIGGGLLGFVAGEMLVTDPALKGWLTGLGVVFEGEKPTVGGISLEIIVGLIGAVIVIAIGTLIGKRRAMKAAVHDAAVEADRPKS